MSREITFEQLHDLCKLHKFTLYVVSHCKDNYFMVHVVGRAKKLDHCLTGEDVGSLFEMIYRHLETGGFIESPGHKVDPSENELLETKQAPSGLSAFL